MLGQARVPYVLSTEQNPREMEGNLRKKSSQMAPNKKQQHERSGFFF